MKNAILIHGKANEAKYYDASLASPSNASWLPWLQKQLLLHDILAQTPEMPLPYQPEYNAWCKEFERFDVADDTILIGHSCGGGFLLRWLSEHPDVRAGTVVLVAPWLDPDRTGNTGSFFDFALDALLTKRVAKLTIFNSTDDFDGIKTSIEMIKTAIPHLRVKDFEGYGHFVEITEFPELAAEVLSDS